MVIGDGVTDMQARPPAQLFIGYGGVVQRKPVKEGADLYVTDLQVLPSTTVFTSTFNRIHTHSYTWYTAYFTGDNGSAGCLII